MSGLTRRAVAALAVAALAAPFLGGSQAPQTTLADEQDRHLYEQRVEDELDRLDEKIDELAGKAQKLRKAKRRELERDLRVLRRRQRKAEDRLDSLRQAGAEGWRDFQDNVEVLLEDLRGDLRRAAQEATRQEEPAEEPAQDLPPEPAP